MDSIFIDGIHEYNYKEEEVENGTLHALYRSHDNSWSESAKGEVVALILNDGNGFKIKYPKKIGYMDYSQAFAISILLKKLSFNDHIVEISQKPVLL